VWKPRCSLETPYLLRAGVDVGGGFLAIVYTPLLSVDIYVYRGVELTSRIIDASEHILDILLDKRDGHDVPPTKVDTLTD